MPTSVIDLDGLRFAMVSSTASIVDPHAPTTFTYHQEGQLVWGEYTGDTVTEGRFVGSVEGDLVSISFAHALASDGTVVRGSADSRIEHADDGRMRLVESFAVGGVEHESICIQL
ncbi:hypothetical protein [Microbacterium sp. dk485]|uniref:hypothetical protein n=1 Tax=Microbacterium sp. dk485 TaxID=2560021 RepID=UPI001ADDBF34|nr:hypothetical protein [Microbacterium sp. dk485]